MKLHDSTEVVIAAAIGLAVLSVGLLIVYAVCPAKLDLQAQKPRPFHDVVGRQDCAVRDEACMRGLDQ